LLIQLLVLFLNNNYKIQSFVVFIGLFSTHLTYIIIAVIYIFGYGTYALNVKQKQSESNNTKHSITAQNKNQHTVNKNSSYFAQTYSNNKTTACRKNKISYTIFSETLSFSFKSVDHEKWISYNWSLLPDTRPSPVCTLHA
jgi:L-cystine uptake protein TcyP (sodium:dicarboxylate symporter family)